MRNLLVFPFLAASLMAQSFIEGSVIDSLTGLPVSGAYLVANGNISGDPMPVTDSAGHFRIESANNRIFLSARHNGYLYSNKSLTLAPGEAASEIRILLTPQAVISGRVLDENGLPVRGARVTATQSRVVNGQRQLREWRAGTETNELGEYRIFDLPAGRYYLGFAPEKLANWDPQYNARLYPDATDVKDAQTIDVKAGEEIGERDFRLSRQEGVTIAGRVVWPDTPAAKRTVSLYLQSTQYPDYSIHVTQPDSDTFSIAHVPPGDYTLRTWANTLHPRIGDLMGDLTVQVGRADIRDVRLEVRPIEQQDVPGNIIFLGRTRPGPIAVTLQSATGAISVVSNADGSFVLKGLLPGSYMLNASSAAANGVPRTNGSIVAARLGTRDVLEQGFDIGTGPAGALQICVAAIAAKLGGKLLDAAGRPVSGAAILLLSQTDNVRSYAHIEDDGTFTASVFSSGEHRIFVVSGADAYDSFHDSDFLESHRNDFPAVRIAEGANPPLILRLPQ